MYYFHYQQIVKLIFDKWVETCNKVSKSECDAEFNNNFYGKMTTDGKDDGVTLILNIKLQKGWLIVDTQNVLNTLRPA